MAYQSFLSKGDTPQPNDTRWTELVRWLSQLQNQAGADPENNPKLTDTRRQLLFKIARATEAT